MSKPRRIDRGKTSVDEFHQHATRLAAANRDPTSMNRAFHRITQRRATYILDRLAGDETHFAQARRNSIHTVDADDLPNLPRLKLIQGGQCTYPY